MSCLPTVGAFRDPGVGSWIWDEDGKKYLDLGGGVAVNCLGHAHPRIVETLHAQASRLIHASNLYYNHLQGELAAKLVSLTGDGKVFFCNSGAEANETLIKLSRRYGHTQGRFEVITALNSFHGRTMAGISATGQQKVKETFEPLLPGFVHVPYNDLAAVEGAINERTSAVLIEGIQGEGGIQPARVDYLLGLRELTRKQRLLLLWDGVQCGCYRTGHFHSYQTLLEGHPQASPSFPTALPWPNRSEAASPSERPGSGRLMRIFPAGSHGSTFGGTPLACAVALSVLAEIEEKQLPAHIVQMGRRLVAGLEKLKATKPILDIRGIGGMIGMALREDGPAACARLRDRGLADCPRHRECSPVPAAAQCQSEEIDLALALVEKAL